MKILLIDSNKAFQEKVLVEWGVPDTEIRASDSESGILKFVSEGDLGAVFLSTDFLTIDNLDTINLIREHNMGVEIFVLAEQSETSLAEECVRKGAHSYLVRPVNVHILESLVRKVMARALTRHNHRTLENHLMQDLLGSTPAMQKVLGTISKVAPTNSSILIEGETGTGKEFIANLIHRMSNRADHPFIAVNCGAIPENLIESELFGVKKGAFTGAVADRKGLFEEADTGTLFLDEIGDLPFSVQVKLLRFLQEKEVRKVGGSESRIVDVRIIAATHVNLHKAVQENRFREDLFYRLNVFHLQLPALRDRTETIPHLIRFFVKKYTKENEHHISGIAKDAESILIHYEYPGNIRELENIVEHAVVLCDGNYILKEHLPEHLTMPREDSSVLSLPSSSEKGHHSRTLQTLSEVEKAHITHALKELNNNQTEVSKKLGISRSTLWRKIKEHQIKVAD
jgi:DNA-binding NtrC family response regulator